MSKKQPKGKRREFVDVDVSNCLDELRRRLCAASDEWARELMILDTIVLPKDPREPSSLIRFVRDEIASLIDQLHEHTHERCYVET